MPRVVFLLIPVRAQLAATPQGVARRFYSWYLHQLPRENVNPLKQKMTALKYLTPQLYANAWRLIRRMDADIFICAQDWDPGWEKNFCVSTPPIKNNNATATVTLPSGEMDKIKINLTPIKGLLIGASIKLLARIDSRSLRRSQYGWCRCSAVADLPIE